MKQLLILFSFFGFISCSKSNIEPIPTLKTDDLNGTWVNNRYPNVTFKITHVDKKYNIIYRHDLNGKFEEENYIGEFSSSNFLQTENQIHLDKLDKNKYILLYNSYIEYSLLTGRFYKK